MHVGEHVIGVDSCLHRPLSLENCVNGADTGVVGSPRADSIATERDRGSPAPARRAVVLFGGTAFVALHDWLGLGGPASTSRSTDALYDAVVARRRARLPGSARGCRPERAAWILIGARDPRLGRGRDLLDGDDRSNPDAPYPSPADIGYLAFYPFADAGLALLVRARAHEINWRLWMDGLIAALGTAALGTAFIFDFVADQTTGTPLEVATTLAYPLGDIVDVLARRRRRRPDRLAAGPHLVAAACRARRDGVADIAYTLQSTDASLPGGDWVDPIYLISAACLGAAAWQPTARRRSPPTRASTAGASCRPRLLRGGDDRPLRDALLRRHQRPLDRALGGDDVAVIIRLAMSVRENRRLLEQVRTDPLTGLGNRGRMQVDLESPLRARRRAAADALLLDLNGFKRYNDTFGHPAGDAMLGRSEAGCARRSARDGTAYRVGGDEFAC